MGSYIIKRLLLAIGTTLIVGIIVSIMVRLIPGDVIDVVLGPQSATLSPEQFEELRLELMQRMGLDVPMPVAIGRWFKGIFLKGDLGVSLWYNESVTQLIKDRLPVTFELGLISFLIGWVIAIPVGVISGIRQDTVGDYLARGFAIFWMAVPIFWTGTLVVVLPTVWWGTMIMSLTYVPITENLLENLVQFVIPAFIMGSSMAGGNARVVRSCVLEVLRQDYVRTAWSKGLTERVVITRHILSNAMLPVITMVGLTLPVLVGGSVIMERIFDLPGMGMLFVDAAFKRDYTVMCGFTFFMTVVVLGSNLLTDLLYAYLDPRVRYQ